MLGLVLLSYVAVTGVLGSGLSIYVGLESAGLSVGEGIAGSQYSGLLERVCVGFYYWSLGVISVLCIHVLLPGSLLGLLPFVLSWWLFCGGLSLLVLPLTSMGYSGLLHTLTLFTRGYYQDNGVGSDSVRNGSSSSHVLTSYSALCVFMDLLSFTSLIRCFWSVGNWLYQCL